MVPGEDKPSHAAQLSRASELIAARRPEMAERIIRNVLSENPNSALGLAFLAMALADRGSSSEAVAAADQAVRLDPDLAVAHAARYRALEARGLPWDAELAARKALELSPFEPNRYSDMGTHLLRWSRLDESVAACKAGLGINPRHLPCLHVLSIALVALDRVDEAGMALSAALLEAPEEAALHATVGLALEGTGRLDQAERAYREALRLDAQEKGALKGLRRVTAWYARITPQFLLMSARRSLRRR
jgi:tetratricopeptide (TPR) repeat protein